MNRFFQAFVIILTVTSCIPNKKVVYLQEKETSSVQYDSLIKMEYPEYQLQMGDILSIEVKSSDPNVTRIFQQGQGNMMNQGAMGGAADINYLTGFPLNIQGEVELPLVETVYVEGLTLLESKEKIQLEIRKYITDAYVQVRLGGIRFTALGEFARPGRYSILQSQVTIFEAIATAGDLTVLANREQALIIRQYPDGSKVHKVDLTDRELMKSDFYYIRPNDQLYLEPLPVRQFGSGVGVTGFQTFTTLLSVVSSTLLVIITLNNLN